MIRKIIRGVGTTSFRTCNLAKLADKTFLNLWSYPNLFIDKKDGGKGNGKELCDLLVVCGDDIIIFSDKSIEWPTGVDYKIAWPRWYRRAIDKSVAQIRGAERWLRDFPNRIFLDAACTERFPIGLPPPERRRVHGVIVALGAGKACEEFYGDSSGTFPIAPSVKGAAHVSQDPRDAPAFGIGDVNPDGAFVHVFSDEALDIFMKERDTVTDFVSYLTRRERFIGQGTSDWRPAKRTYSPTIFSTEANLGMTLCLRMAKRGRRERSSPFLVENMSASYGTRPTLPRKRPMRCPMCGIGWLTNSRPIFWQGHPWSWPTKSPMPRGRKSALRASWQ